MNPIFFVIFVVMGVATAIKFRSEIKAFLSAPVERGNTMTGWKAVAVFLLFLLPLFAGTLGLAGYTIGEAITPNKSDQTTIGTWVALLTVAFAAYLFFFSRPAEASGSRLSSTLVVSGAVCILGALALQFYLVHIASENSRRSAEIVAQNLDKPGITQAKVNVKTELPNTVKPLGYFAFLAGVWLAVVGIHIGVARRQPDPARETPIQPSVPAPSPPA